MGGVGVDDWATFTEHKVTVDVSPALYQRLCRIRESLGVPEAEMEDVLLGMAMAAEGLMGEKKWMTENQSD